MAFSIQTNVNSLNRAGESARQQRLPEPHDPTADVRLPHQQSGTGDDAAGLAIANKFRSDVAELTQGVRNANDGISTLQIVDGGMNNISKMLDRLKTAGHAVRLGNLYRRPHRAE